MQAMKDIAVLSAALSASPIAQSPIWHQPLDRVIPAQLLAFRERMKANGQLNQADAAIDYVLTRVGHMTDTGALPAVPMLDYTEPQHDVMTAGELVTGFERMSRPVPALILFALEMNLTPDEVIVLTRQRVRKMNLTPRAREIVAAQPLSLATKFVFWRDYEGRHMPVFGFDQELFDAFGEVWSEFKPRADNMLWLT